MEKRISLIVISIILIFNSSLFSQNLNQNDRIQLLLWAEKEAYPGVDWNSGKAPEVNENDDNPYMLPVSRLKVTAPFFVEGMVYGWSFEYSPSDKARNVKEYMEFNPVQKMNEIELAGIRYKNAAFKDDRLYCRVEYDRSEVQAATFKSWQTITNPKVRGIGYGRLEDGFEGLREACAQAVKDGVREYWRRKIKNKPREISGRIIICTAPVIGVDAGRYRVSLDFFMETDRIVEYKMF